MWMLTIQLEYKKKKKYVSMLYNENYRKKYLQLVITYLHENLATSSIF